MIKPGQASRRNYGQGTKKGVDMSGINRDDEKYMVSWVYKDGSLKGKSSKPMTLELAQTWAIYCNIYYPEIVHSAVPWEPGEVDQAESGEAA